MSMLCSTMERDHWMMRLAEFSEVRKIVHSMVCDNCATKAADHQSVDICIHKFHLRPQHIDVRSVSTRKEARGVQKGGDRKDILHRMMDLVAEGFYSREILGIASADEDDARRVFPSGVIEKLALHNRITLTDSIVEEVQSIVVVVDPVQATSRSSGVGLCVLLKTKTGNFYVRVWCCFLFLGGTITQATTKASNFQKMQSFRLIFYFFHINHKESGHNALPSSSCWPHC